MNLSEFIEETLSEILAGIRAVQSKEGGMARWCHSSTGRAS
jgi:hypothetical protein